MFYYGCVVLGKDVDSEYREKCKDFCSQFVYYLLYLY